MCRKKELDASTYDEMIFKIDRFMPESSELMERYYRILEGESSHEDKITSITNFIEENANGNMWNYMPTDGTLCHMVERLVELFGTNYNVLTT